MTGESYGEAMNRLYSDPGHSRDEWNDAAGAFLASILGGSEPEPGPPYTHTIVPPEPIGEDEDGNLLYPAPPARRIHLDIRRRMISWAPRGPSAQNSGARGTGHALSPPGGRLVDCGFPLPSLRS